MSHKLPKPPKRIGDGLHGTPDIYDDNGQVWFINGNNLGNQTITFKSDTKRLSVSERDKYQNLKLDCNTILISLNGSYGETSFYNGEDVLLGKSAGYIILNPDVDKHFIRWFLQSNSVKMELDLSLSGTTIANVSLFTLNNLTILYPNASEQQRISSYLTSVINDIDDLITVKQTMADKLREYRRSLISEAVTGKFKVPGV
ncbi:MAG: restriction endonuclease subunit S [Coriobacteriales bacterium]|nr:restriction endonuclease subunit S [Coriobacteriales bacterium]